MNKYIFIQARMSSSRLPGKVLLPFGDSTVLQTIYEKCRCISGVKNVVILTSTETDDDEIQELCSLNDMQIFRGSLNNVLGRFQDAARAICKAQDFIVRICADSPLISASLLQDFIDDLDCDDVVLSTRCVSNKGIISTTGKGNNLDAIITSELLNIIAHDESIREHIIYGFDYSKGFRLFKPNFELESELKLNLNQCIDTEEDYARLTEC